MRLLFGIFRRLSWLVVGVAVGWASSLALTRRVRRITRRFSPTTGRGDVRAEVRAAVREGRDAMRRREAELRGAAPPAK